MTIKNKMISLQAKEVCNRLKRYLLRDSFVTASPKACRFFCDAACEDVGRTTAKHSYAPKKLLTPR